MWPFKRKEPVSNKESIDVKKPVTNPGLKSAISIFNSNKTETNLQKVLLEIKNATFLVLVNNDELKTTKTPKEGRVTFEAGSKLKFFKTFDEKGNAFIPLFTDWKEINLWIEVKTGVFAWIMPTEEAFNFVLKNKTVGLVINPCTDKWEVNNEQITNFLNEIIGHI